MADYDDNDPPFRVIATLRHKGVEYRVAHAYVWSRKASATFEWEENNDSCDCNRSLYINRCCDPAFPIMPCGDEIELIGLEFVPVEAN